MRRGTKLAVATLLVVTFFWVGVAAAVGWAVHAVATSPAIEVEVRENRGSRGRVSLRLPAALLVAGVALAPGDARQALTAGIGAEIDLAAWGPAAAELGRQLETMPDATLIEIRDGGEHVVVAKIGDDLRLRVRSPDTDVDVTLPAGLAADLLADLASER